MAFNLGSLQGALGNPAFSNFAGLALQALADPRAAAKQLAPLAEPLTPSSNAMEPSIASQQLANALVPSLNAGAPGSNQPGIPQPQEPTPPPTPPTPPTPIPETDPAGTPPVRTDNLAAQLGLLGQALQSSQPSGGQPVLNAPGAVAPQRADPSALLNASAQNPIMQFLQQPNAAVPGQFTLGDLLRPNQQQLPIF